jgi:hypothetical protein
LGYIGNISANSYIQLQSESTSLGYSVNGNLRTAGEIQTTGTNVINFGYDQTKADGATGRIGYGTYDGNTLCIVGGSTSGERVVSMWDRLKMNGRITTSGTVIASDSVTGCKIICSQFYIASTTIAGSYGLFVPINSFISLGLTHLNYAIYMSINGGGGTGETTGFLWCNSSSGVLGGTSDFNSGISVLSQAFYDSGNYYWRIYSDSIMIFGATAYVKLLG